MSIPQGSSLSPILFLFFNADLVELYANSTCKVADLSFVNNINILACGSSTEANCQLLEKVHSDCIVWAAHHRTTFTSQKYELIHLFQSCKFNMKICM